MLFLLLVISGACLSCIEATSVRSPHLRGGDSYNHLPTSNSTFQNREVVVDEARSRGGEWPMQEHSSLNTAASSCGEGNSFTISSQKHSNLAGCYKKTGKYNGEALYTFENRMGRKYTVASINFNETNASPDVHWTLVRMDSLHHDIFCISADFAYHTHPLDASWTCDFSSSAMSPSLRGIVPIAANPNDITFSCGCPTAKRDSPYQTAYHRRKTEDNVTGFLNGMFWLLLLSSLIVRLCIRVHAQQTPRVVERQIVLVRVPTRRARGAQCSSSAETARNTQTAATIPSNEPGSEIEMMRPLHRPDGAATNPGDLPEEEERLLDVLQ